MCVIVMIMIINLLAINSKMIRKNNTIHTIQFIYNKERLIQAGYIKESL